MLQLFGERAEHQVRDVVLVEHRLLFDRQQVTVDAHQRTVVRGQEQVGTAALPERVQEPVDGREADRADGHEPYLPQLLQFWFRRGFVTG